MRRSRNHLNLFRALAEEPFSHDFFQMLRELDCAFPDKPRMGSALRPQDEAVRLGQEPSMTFAPAALSAFEPARGQSPPRLLVRFFGLLGPNGALPLHLTDYARERQLHHGDPTFARFLDLLHHRFLSLFYRAWAQAQPTVSFDRPREDRFADYVGAMVGIAAPTLKKRDAAGDAVKLFYSGWLSRQVRNADGLGAILAGFFRLPVEVETFVGHWMRLPSDDLTRLGARNAGATVSVGAVLGSRVWDRQHKFRLHFGPLTLDEYERFLPGGTALPRLVALVRQYFCFELYWDARLVLRADEVPRVRLGQYGRLGWTTWLGAYRKQRPADSLTLDAERLCGAAVH
jgi:type VI secretion system protein ImpH